MSCGRCQEAVGRCRESPRHIAIRVRREPGGGIFPNPRSCGGFRCEKANAVLRSVVERNQYIPT
jgi:hypothetical protein